MWSVQSDKIKQHKKRVNYTINKHTIDRFKIVADKDMRKTSNIVEKSIRLYVESKLNKIEENFDKVIEIYQIYFYYMRYLVLFYLNF